MERITEKSEVNDVEVVLLRQRLIELFNRRNRALEVLAGELEGEPVEVEHRADVEQGDVLEEVADAVGVELDDAT